MLSRLQLDQFILLESTMWRSITGSQSVMVVGFVEVEFVVVHVSISAHVLTKFASSAKVESLQLYLMWSVFGPRTRGVPCSRKCR